MWNYVSTCQEIKEISGKCPKFSKTGDSVERYVHLNLILFNASFVFKLTIVTSYGAICFNFLSYVTWVSFVLELWFWSIKIYRGILEFQTPPSFWVNISPHLSWISSKNLPCRKMKDSTGNNFELKLYPKRDKTLVKKLNCTVFSKKLPLVVNWNQNLHLKVYFPVR